MDAEYHNVPLISIREDGAFLYIFAVLIKNTFKCFDGQKVICVLPDVLEYKSNEVYALQNIYLMIACL